MNGFKLLKTTYGAGKEIIGVHFNGENNYNLFVEEAKAVYNLPADSDVQVLSKGFVIRPNIFSSFVEQYIGSLDLILDIQVTEKCPPIITPAPITTPVPIVYSSENSLLQPRVSPTLQMHGNLSHVSDTEFLNYDQPNTPSPVHMNVSHASSTDFYNNTKTYLPSTQEIKEIQDVQNMLRLKVLENKHRTKIAKAIIAHIIGNSDRKLSRQDFMHLSQSVIEIFPFEVPETYYVPFHKNHTARGKLYDAYNNTRARLSEAGIISRRSKIRPENTSRASPNAPVRKYVDMLPENAAEFEVLKSDKSDWPSVVTAWHKSHSFRQLELQNENFNTNDYIDKYQVLLNDKCNELFAIDFQILYPVTKNIYEWQWYYLKIVEKAENLKDNGARDVLKLFKNTVDEDARLALSLMLIAYLLPNPRYSTKLEIQESFMIYHEKIPEAEDEDESYAKRMKPVIQPKIILYGGGDDKKTISCACVVIGAKKLKFESPMKAIEVCVQSYITMNIRYPRQCAHVWFFIQHMIFEINTPYDSVIPSVNTLINDLRSDREVKFEICY